MYLNVTGDSPKVFGMELSSNGIFFCSVCTLHMEVPL